MKITSKLIDCTFTFQPYDKKLEEIKIDIAKRLPTRSLITRSNVLIVGTETGDHIIKIRPGYKNFMNRDFIEISWKDYIWDKSWQDRIRKTEKLMRPGDYVYFKMEGFSKSLYD